MSDFYYRIDDGELHLSNNEGTLAKQDEDGLWPWSDYVSITKAVIEDKIAPATCQSLFDSVYALTEIEGLENLDTSQVTDMSDMFYGCYSLTEIDGLDKLDTSNVKRLDAMFFDCNRLRSLAGVENWDVSNVTSMHLLFGNCSSIQTPLDLSSWDVSNVTDADLAFHAFGNIGNLDLSNWCLSPSVDVQSMFDYDPSTPTAPIHDNWPVTNIQALALDFPRDATLASEARLFSHTVPLASQSLSAAITEVSASITALQDRLASLQQALSSPSKPQTR